MDKKEFFKQYNLFLKDFRLKPEQVIVGSGATLMLFGLRDEIGDIDVAVPIDVFNTIKKHYPETTVEMQETTGIRKFRIIKDIQGCIDVHILEQQKWIVKEGVGSYTLEEVLKQKKLMNRPKDQIDIKNIENYMKSKHYKLSQEDCSNEQINLVNNKKRRTRIDVAAYQGNMILAAYQDETETYDFPGGGLDKGETNEQAAIREGMEEAGWVIQSPTAITLPGDWVFNGLDDKWFHGSGWDEELEIGVIAEAVIFKPDYRFSSEGDARIFSLVPIGQVKASLQQAIMNEISRPRQKLIYQLRLKMIESIEQRLQSKPKFLNW